MCPSQSSLIATESELENVLSDPGQEVIQALSQLDGDLLILGVDGKMGPHSGEDGETSGQELWD